MTKYDKILFNSWIIIANRAYNSSVLNIHYKNFNKEIRIRYIIELITRNNIYL